MERVAQIKEVIEKVERGEELTSTEEEIWKDIQAYVIGAKI